MATIRTNGVETYYERRGDGPTVVFVHASMLDHSVWDEQVDALSGDYGRVERLREARPRMTTNEFAKVVRSMVRPRNPPLDLSSVSAPTLVLYGENELPFAELHAARFAAHVPTVGVDEVPDAGHVSNLDTPEYVTEAIRAFLAARAGEFDRPNGSETR